jgi:hypothetical protein
MIIPKYFKLSQLLNERVIEDKMVEELLNGSDDLILDSPKVISKVSKFFETFEFTQIDQLESQTNKDNFKIKFILMAVLPQDPKEYCRLFCKSCKKSFSFRDLLTESNSDFAMLCPICDELSLPVWQMTFLVKDNPYSEEFFKVNYFTHFNTVTLGFEDSGI